MDDASPTFRRCAHLLTQTGEVCGKNRRCQFDQWGLLRTDLFRTWIFVKKDCKNFTTHEA
jgi:hypothetical protein